MTSCVSMKHMVKIAAQNADVRMGPHATHTMVHVIVQQAGLVRHVTHDALMVFMVMDVTYNAEYAILPLVSAIKTLESVHARKAFLVLTVTRLALLVTMDISAGHVTVSMEQHVTISMEHVTALQQDI